MKVTRRKFLRYGAVAVGVLSLSAVGVTVASHLRPDASCRRLVGKWVRDALPGFTIARADLNAFADAFVERNFQPDARRTWVFLSTHLVWYPVLAWLLGWTAKGPMLRAMADEAPRQFLRCSDVFITSATPGQSVHFLAWYDPFERPCSNPFADLSPAT